MRFFGDILITDPCYLMKSNDDWKRCEFGERLEVLGIDHYYCRDTIEGDWSCTISDAETGGKLGEFCADSGMVVVALLSEVLRYNPNFDYHIKKPWTAAVINGFDGEIDEEIITLNIDSGDEHPVEYYELHIIGRGNINFITHPQRDTE